MRETIETWWTNTNVDWKIIAFLSAFAMGFILKSLLSYLLTFVKKLPTSEKGAQKFFNYLLQLRVRGVIAWILTCGFWFLCIDAIQIPAGIEKYFVGLVKLVISYNLIRLAYLCADAFGKTFKDSVKIKSDKVDDQLAPFLTKTLKVLVVIFGTLIAIQQFGINVMSILAGLGLGGLALALAAQDTVSNLFGSVTIILDRPFMIGDYIRVNDVEGTVEEIGFRSTRIRTATTSVVSVPNATMAKEKIDNLGLRPARRIRNNVGIEYGTDVNKIKEFVKKVTEIVFHHPKTLKEDITVKLNTLNDNSIGILVNYYAAVTTYKEETETQEEILFEIIELSQKMGIVFAALAPTQYKKS